MGEKGEGRMERGDFAGNRRKEEEKWEGGEGGRSLVKK
jgi:hypothetical protein